MELESLSMGPLYSDNDVIARLLIRVTAEAYLANEAIDVTKIEMLCCDGGEYGGQGLQVVSGVEATTPIVIGPRMYTKGVPPGRQLHKIYGITSPAFD